MNRKKEPIPVQEILAPVGAVAAFVVTYEVLATSKAYLEAIGGRTSLWGMGLANIRELIL